MYLVEHKPPSVSPSPSARRRRFPAPPNAHHLPRHDYRLRCRRRPISSSPVIISPVPHAAVPPRQGTALAARSTTTTITGISWSSRTSSALFHHHNSIPATLHRLGPPSARRPIRTRQATGGARFRVRPAVTPTREHSETCGLKPNHFPV